MKPTINTIDIDIYTDNIQIILQTSEGEKHIQLPNYLKNGCQIDSSDIGGMNEHEAGIFLTCNGERTRKI